MASAAAMSAARSMPSVYSIPLGPRVRPPRLLPGTKADNTNPQPEGPVPEDKVWVQGKWRDRLSNAAKDRRRLQSKQVEKALRHSTHGMNIYAYRQIRTNQVVFSLSRVMQNNKILPQLIYHGKQTKPAALRRDVWRPYFAIHFPQTKAGAEAGLDTFQLLRELSARRQLSPPEGFLHATKEDVRKAEERYDPATLARLKEEKSSILSRLPKLGQLLSPKYRAQKLMDQKASSVADVAFALNRINEAKLSPDVKVAKMQAQLVSKHQERSRRDRRRINEIRRKEDAKDTQIQARQKGVDAAPGQLSLDKYSAERIALEHDGVLTSKDRITGLTESLVNGQPYSSDQSSASLQQFGPRPVKFDAEQFTKEFTEEWDEKHKNSNPQPPFPQDELERMIQEKKAQSDEDFQQWQSREQEVGVTSSVAGGEASRSVLVLWSDLRDAMNAKSWSVNVQHDWLDAKAVVKKQRTVIRQPAYIDEDGHEIEEQRQTRLFQTASSPHIMGRDVSDNWMTNHQQIAQEADAKTTEWDATRRENIVRAMIDARSKVTTLRSRAEKAKSTSTHSFSLTQSNNKKSQTLVDAEQRSELLNATYPEYAIALDQLAYFSELIHRNRKLVQEVNELEPGVEGRQQLMGLEHALAKEIRDECDTTFPGFSAFERARQDSLEISQSRSQAEESRAELDVKTIDLVLAQHRKILRDAGDGADDTSYTTTAHHTPGGPRNMDMKDLKDLNVEVDMQELDKRSVWSRVKSAFGR